jgi:hypothetical protein
MWLQEHTKGGLRGAYSMCCSKGKVNLKLPRIPFVPIFDASNPRIALAPENFYKNLFENQTYLPIPSRFAFHNHTRAYNNAFAMASTAVKLEAPPGIHQVNGSTDSRSFSLMSHFLTLCLLQFRIQGGMYHRMDSIIARGGQQPAFNQLYILDEPDAIQARLSNDLRLMNGPGQQPNLHTRIVTPLTHILHRCNRYASHFKTLSELAQANVGTATVHMEIVREGAEM